MNFHQTIRAIIVILIMPVYIFAADTEQKDDPLKKAEKYFFQKKYEMAEMLLQEFLKKDPENALAYSYLGDIFLQKKRYDAAQNMYLKAVDLDPNNPENYFRLGQVYYYQKLGPMAIENFQKSLDMDKSLKFAYYHLGLTYLMIQRDKENTIKNWETFLKVAPEDSQYEKIKRVVELLRNPNFVIPPQGSEISIEEALLLGDATMKKVDRDAEEKKAGNEAKKTKKKLEGLYLEDEL